MVVEPPLPRLVADALLAQRVLQEGRNVPPGCCPAAEFCPFQSRTSPSKALCAVVKNVLESLLLQLSGRPRGVSQVFSSGLGASWGGSAAIPASVRKQRYLIPDLSRLMSPFLRSLSI